MKDYVDVIIKFIKELGFPIAVVIYLFWERHGILSELVRTLNEVLPLLRIISENTK